MISAPRLTGNLLIAGHQQPGKGATFHGINPATSGALETTFHEAIASQVAEAAAAAEAAFHEFSLVPPRRRAEFLRAIARELLAAGAPLLERASLETALPVARLESERGRTMHQLHLLADVLDEGSWVEARIDTGDASRAPVPKPDLRRMLVALGPVAVFSASNFPFAYSIVGGDTASAFAAGCPVVCKAHPAHPGTSELTAAALLRAIESMRHATRRVFNAARMVARSRDFAGAGCAHQGGGIHRIVARRTCNFRRGASAPGTHSGVRRNGECQPGLSSAVGRARTFGANR